MYEQFEDAATFSLMGQTVYMYGLFVALGAAAALVLMALLQKKRALKSGTAVLTFALGIPLALVLSRVMYCAFDTNFTPLFSIKAALNLSGGGYAMVGALLGAVLAALLCARITGQKAANVLDVLVPALLIFIAFERVGEGFTVLGISRPLVYDAFKGSFLAQMDDYDAYLRTWILEAAVAVVLSVVCAVLLKKEKRTGDTARKGALLFFLTQVFLESLRYDQHLKYGFVGVQHVLYYLLASALVIYFARRAIKGGAKKTLPIVACVYMVVGAGLLILIEFMIDRTSINRFLLYFGYAVLLAVPAVMGFALVKREGVRA